MKFESTLLLAALAVAAAQQHDMTQHDTYYEVNYDFTGKDLNHTKQAQKEFCLDDCLKLDKCTAYSWNNFEGGTCWLKESKGEAVFKAGVISTGIYPSNPQVCQLKDGVDFLGNDLMNLPAATAGECCDKCQKLDKCRAYTWNNFNNGTCWFKTKRGVAVFKDGVSAASAYPDDDYTPAYYADVDFVGHDIGNAAGKFEDCAGGCSKWLGCRAYTWTDYQGGTCWFKAAKDKVSAKNGAKSGVVDKPIAKATEKDDVDYIDNDFKNVAGIPEATDCVQICADVPDCKAVTWNDYRKGTCWLKHQVGNEVANKGVKAFAMA